MTPNYQQDIHMRHCHYQKYGYVARWYDKNENTYSEEMLIEKEGYKYPWRNNNKLNQEEAWKIACWEPIRPIIYHPCA